MSHRAERTVAEKPSRHTRKVIRGARLRSLAPAHVRVYRLIWLMRSACVVTVSAGICFAIAVAFAFDSVPFLPLPLSVDRLAERLAVGSARSASGERDISSRK